LSCWLLLIKDTVSKVNEELQQDNAVRLKALEEEDQEVQGDDSSNKQNNNNSIKALRLMCICVILESKSQTVKIQNKIIYIT
jgi:hypothetical protein